MAVKPLATAQDDLQLLRDEHALLEEEIRQLIGELQDQLSVLSALLANAEWIIAQESEEYPCRRFKM